MLDVNVKLRISEEKKRNSEIGWKRENIRMNDQVCIHSWQNVKHLA